MNSRFSGSSGFGSWFGNVPSGSKKQRTTSIGNRSSTGGSMTPAMPFAASITTRSGLTASTSMNESTASTQRGQMSSCADTCQGLTLGPVLEGRRPRTDLHQPRVAADRKRAAPDDLHAGVLLGIVRGGDHDPAFEVEVADGEIDHLGPDHAEIDRRPRRPPPRRA